MDLGNAAERQNASVNPSLGAMFPPNPRLETRNPRVRDGATPFPPLVPQLRGWVEAPLLWAPEAKAPMQIAISEKTMDVTDICIQVC